MSRVKTGSRGTVAGLVEELAGVVRGRRGENMQAASPADTSNDLVDEVADWEDPQHDRRDDPRSSRGRCGARR